jgi:hypothetical protein
MFAEPVGEDLENNTLILLASGWRRFWICGVAAGGHRPAQDRPQAMEAHPGAWHSGPGSKLSTRYCCGARCSCPRASSAQAIRIPPLTASLAKEDRSFVLKQEASKVYGSDLLCGFSQFYFCLLSGIPLGGSLPSCSFARVRLAMVGSMGEELLRMIHLLTCDQNTSSRIGTAPTECRGRRIKMA